jgi:dTDP-N-acetylfucosamine:lipid II N-acetylfucosaminyltransferase
MNHLRQQALGNVVIAGLRGARLFLNPDNPMTRWLHGQGVLVDDIGTLHADPLTSAQRAHNAGAITAFACRAHRRGKTRRLVDELLSRADAKTALAA